MMAAGSWNWIAQRSYGSLAFPGFVICVMCCALAVENSGVPPGAPALAYAPLPPP